MKHAHRVQSLFIGHEAIQWHSEGVPPTHAVDWAILAMLNEHLSSRTIMDSPVFPRLRKLRCNTWADSSSSLSLPACIPFLVGPALTTLHVCYGFQQRSLISLGSLSSVDDAIPRIASRCISLTEVKLSTIGAPEPMLSSRSLRSIMRRGRNIRVFNIDMPLDQDYLMALGTSETLTKVTTTVDLTHVSSYLPCATTLWGPDSSFQSLQTLDLRVRHIGACTSALSLLSPATPLRSLKLRTGLWAEESESYRFFAALSRFRTLEHIEIELSGAIRVNGDCHTTFEALAQLFVLPNVTKFHIYHDFWFSSHLVLDMFDIKAMAKAWPRLNSLRLQSIEFPGYLTPLYDMAALVSFQQHFPCLEQLSLDVDASGDCSQVLTGAPDCSMAPHPLRILDVSPKSQKLPIANPRDVAGALHAIFPKLEKLKYAVYKDWGPVEACLSELPGSTLQSTRESY